MHRTFVLVILPSRKRRDACLDSPEAKQALCHAERLGSAVDLGEKPMLEWDSLSELMAEGVWRMAEATAESDSSELVLSA
jgi:hypothetical protein